MSEPRDPRDPTFAAADLERRLRETEALLREVEALADLGSWEWDVRDDSVRWSDELYRIFGLKPDEFDATLEGYLERVHPGDQELARRNVTGALAAREPFASDYRILLPDGGVRWLHSRGRIVLDENGEPARMVGTCQDVTDDRQLVEWLARRALHDPLTGVLNRSLIIDRLEHALARSSRLDTHTAVLFVDVDDFKRVNDDLGHPVGDEVLRSLAQRMRSSVRSGDTVGRYGGDEFVVICEDLKARADALAVANRIVQAVDVTVPDTGDVAVVTASIGLAVASGGESAASVIRNADVAMYRAKQRGRGLVEVFDAGDVTNA